MWRSHLLARGRWLVTYAIRGNGRGKKHCTQREKSPVYHIFSRWDSNHLSPSNISTTPCRQRMKHIDLFVYGHPLLAGNRVSPFLPNILRRPSVAISLAQQTRRSWEMELCPPLRLLHPHLPRPQFPRLRTRPLPRPSSKLTKRGNFRNLGHRYVQEDVVLSWPERPLYFVPWGVWLLSARHRHSSDAPRGTFVIAMWIPLVDESSSE